MRSRFLSAPPGDPISRVAAHLAVSLGGALGASSRYGVSEWIGVPKPGNFPWSTLLVNLTGSALIMGILALVSQDDRWTFVRLLSVTGFLGAYTTLSAFSLETANLLRAGAWLSAFAYVAISLIGGLALAILAYGSTVRWQAGRRDR